jgi:CYTH domain-containing protein
MPSPETDPAASHASASTLDRSAADGLEIERKFLVTQPPADLDSYPSERISQGYLSLDPEGAEVRLRKRGYHTLLTIKSGIGMARAEEEFLIDGPRFDRLWAGTTGRRIEKRRYKIPTVDELTIELDVFEGALAGLVMAEVEFLSVEQAQAYEPQPWMRVDVTDDRRYKNSRLALDGLPERKQVGEHALLDGEPVLAGLIHVATAQVDHAADALQGRDAEPWEKAVHTARKAFKRGRALVRVARDGLGREVAHRDNAALREAGAILSGARDAQVLVETLAKLAKRYPDELTPERIGALEAELVADFEAADAAARGDAGAIAEVLAILAVVREDIAEWELGDDPADALAAGFARIHQKGRKTLRKVHRHGEPGELVTSEYHDLRKRAKDLWHAAELLEIASPKRMRALAQDAHELADLIGDDHDLAVLAERIDDRLHVFDDPADADVIHEAIKRRRRKLQRKGLVAADALYGKKPGALADRVRELGD